MRERKFKKVMAMVAVIGVVSILLASCNSGKKWAGTFGGTSSSGSKVEITIDKNGTVQYNDDGDISVGTWTENENSIALDFGGEVSSSCEPLIVTMTSDKSIITVESGNSSWTSDYYQRR